MQCTVWTIPKRSAWTKLQTVGSLGTWICSPVLSLGPELTQPSTFSHKPPIHNYKKKRTATAGSQTGIPKVTELKWNIDNKTVDCHLPSLPSLDCLEHKYILQSCSRTWTNSAHHILPQPPNSGYQNYQKKRTITEDSQAGTAKVTELKWNIDNTDRRLSSFLELDMSQHTQFWLYINHTYGKRSSDVTIQIHGDTS